MRELVDHIEGINVVLTPGRYNAAFFEHSSSMERAYDNAVVLRDELSSRTLSYIQLALDCMEKHAGRGAFAYDLQPVLDDLFAFWGCLDDNVEDEECRNIIKCGKYLERLDLYMRLDYPYRMIEKEYNKFLNRLHKIRIRYNLSEIDTLNEIMNLGEGASHAWMGFYGCCR